MGARVGVLDGDIYGPNVPIMFGLQAQLETDGKKIRPAEKFGIQIVSMGFLTQEEAPMIWRGPMLHSAIQQFCREVAWKDVDYLVVDMPPGTGDVALSLSQTVPAAGAIVVTTPQQVSLADTPPRGADVSEAQYPDARPRREHEFLRVHQLPSPRRHLRPRRRRADRAATRHSVPRPAAAVSADPRRQRSRHSAGDRRARFRRHPGVQRARRIDRWRSSPWPRTRTSSPTKERFRSSRSSNGRQATGAPRAPVRGRCSASSRWRSFSA